MRNWLDQDIKVGSVVYRGARDGNTSEFKVGKVLKVDEVKGTVRVAWEYQPGYRGGVRIYKQVGTVFEINSLVVMPDETWKLLEEKVNDKT